MAVTVLPILLVQVFVIADATFKLLHFINIPFWMTLFWFSIPQYLVLYILIRNLWIFFVLIFFFKSNIKVSAFAGMQRSYVFCKCRNPKKPTAPWIYYNNERIKSRLFFVLFYTTYACTLKWDFDLESERIWRVLSLLQGIF